MFVACPLPAVERFGNGIITFTGCEYAANVYEHSLCMQATMSWNWLGIGPMQGFVSVERLFWYRDWHYKDKVMKL